MELTQQINTRHGNSKAEGLKSMIHGRPKLRRALGIPLAIRRYWIEREVKRFNSQYENLFKNVQSGHLLLKIDNLQASFNIDFRSSTMRRILREGCYEPLLVDLARKFADRNRDIIDVGANIGLLSVFFAGIINDDSRVLAVEPVPSALNLLRKNLRINDCDNKVDIFEGMAGSESGQSRIDFISGMEEYSSAVGIRHSGAPKDSIQSQLVAMEKLDTLAAGKGLNCGFLKVDTEGYELPVMEGALRILKENRPIIFSEASDTLMQPAGYSVKSLVQLLEDYDYSVSDIRAQGRPLNYPFDGEIIALPKG